MRNLIGLIDITCIIDRWKLANTVWPEVDQTVTLSLRCEHFMRYWKISFNKILGSSFWSQYTISIAYSAQYVFAKEYSLFSEQDLIIWHLGSHFETFRPLRANNRVWAYRQAIKQTVEDSWAAVNRLRFSLYCNLFRRIPSAQNTLLDRLFDVEVQDDGLDHTLGPGGPRGLRTYPFEHHLL